MKRMVTAAGQRGYTLIELLLYMGILGSLLMALTLFFVTSTTSRAKNQTIFEVDQQGVAAMDYITQTVRNASSISSPAAGSSASSLTLAVPTSSLSPTVFDVGSGALEVKEGTGSYVALTNGKVQVTSLTFTNLSRSGTAGIVQISFTVSRLNPNNRNEYDYQQTFTASAALRP